MGSNHGSNRLLPCLAMAVIATMAICGVATADIDKDKEQCADKLVGLATCLPYVGGETPAPTKDCCTGLKQVVTTNLECLCVLIKDHNDPSLNLKINNTLALGLPDSCHTPTDISKCPSLLHLQPGSQEAKVFEDYAKSIKSNNTNIAPPRGNAMKSNSTASDGGRSNTWFGIKIVWGLSIVVLLQ